LPAWSPTNVVPIDMAPVVVKRWDADTRQDVDYNTDVTTTTELDDTDIWDDEPAARLAAERYDAVVCPGFDDPDDDSRRVG
jgi:hypothetical protein